MDIGVVIGIVRRTNNKNKQQQEKQTTIPLEQYFQQSNPSPVRAPTQPVQQTQQPKLNPLITKVIIHSGTKIAIIIDSIFTFLPRGNAWLLIIRLPFLLGGTIHYRNKKQGSQTLFEQQQQPLNGELKRGGPFN